MKKAIKIILIVILILLVAIISIPFIFKGKIQTLVKNEINNNINAKVDFTDFDLTIFSSFPNLTIKLNNLSVVGINEFAGDTLAGIKNTGVTLDIMSVISGSEIEIRSINLNDARLQLLVLKDGKANWDIAKSSGDTAQAASEPSKFKVGLKSYSITDGYLLYSDASLAFETILENFNHEGKGDFTQDLFTLSTKTDIERFTMSYEYVSYILNAKTNIAADLEMDMVNSKYTFHQNEIKLNELGIGLDGFIAMPAEDITMDLKFDAKQNEFKSFLSMIPGAYRSGFDKVQSSGKLQFNGFVKGVYSETTMPGFGLTLEIQNGMFKYPDLPTAVNNVQVDLNITNPDGVPDHTLINLKQLHVEMGSEPFDARMIVKTPVSDADIDATAKGRLDLANISRMIPLEAGTTMKGVMNANITARGRLSSIENREFAKFNAAGSVLLNDFAYTSNDFKEGIQIPIAELIFNPKNLTLNQFDLKTGKTDLKATGWIDNLFTYMFKENELLKGTLDIRSNVIDLNELMGTSASSSAASADTAAMEVVEVPANLDFLVTANINSLYYDDLVLEKLKGNIAIRDQSLGMNDISFQMLDGTVGMNGLYETKNVRKPSFFFDLDLVQMDIKKTYDKFVAVQKMAPIAERCKGKYSATLDVRGNLLTNMDPDLQSFTGGGKLQTSQVTIENFPPLMKLADELKMEQFKKIDVDDVNLSFKFDNGRVNVDPYSVDIEGVKTTISGSNGFDQTIDYDLDMKIPTSMMGSSATGYVTGLLAQANQAAGTNMSLGKEVNVKAKITGTVSDPKVKMNMKDQAAATVTNVKEQLKQELDAKKNELEDQAKAEAERLKKEAEDKARAEAEKLKKEAEAKAKAEADRLKKEAEDKIKKEADDKLKDLFKKPK